jgi:hypothetical protein
VIARLADVLLTRSPLDEASHPATLTPERVFVIGNPLVDVIQRHARAALSAAAWRRYGVSPGGYDLVVLTGDVPPARLTELGARPPLILAARAGDDVPGAAVVTAPTFLERLSLERAARAIHTDSARVHEEAAALGVPCHFIGACAPPAGNERDLPTTATSWDRSAGVRAADAVVANFARVRLIL